MKTNTLKTALAVGLTALLAGSAAAQESTASAPVGYETLTINGGFNYLGLRLHEAPVASGEVTVPASSATIVVPNGIVTALTVGTSYIFEVTSGGAEGAAVSIESFDVAANTLILSDDLTGDFQDGSSFTIRPIATLASVFGVLNDAELDAGFAGTGGADQIWVPQAGGGFAKYYYDNFVATTGSEGWAAVDTLAAVDATEIELFYTDGIIVVGDGPVNSFVVSGSVKLSGTNYGLESGFNYLSSVSPVGATLASTFGENNAAALSAGFAGTGGADQVWIPVTGGFAKYYYDSFVTTTSAEGWANVETLGDVDSTSISFDDSSGLILVNDGSIKMVNSNIPVFYSDL